MRWIGLACLLGVAACGAEEPHSQVTDTDPLTSTDTDDTPTPTVSDSDTDTDTDTDTPSTAIAPNYAASGTASVTTVEGAVMTGGCSLSYTRFNPDVKVSDTTVIFTHGFMRGQHHMVGWAQHLASWGLTVITPELCHATAFDTDHVQNGVDLQNLAASVDVGGGTLYIGHSAGGLASFLASAADPNALAVLGLDPVDADGLGVGAAAGLAIPTSAILGDGSACNSQNNGLAMATAAPDHQVFGIPGADHCSFESPTDGGCTLFCGGNGGALSEVEIADTIAALSVAFSLWRSGADPMASEWWTPGEQRYEDLLSGGRIVTP